MNNLAEKREPVVGLKDVMRSAQQKEPSAVKSKTPVLKVSDEIQKEAEVLWNLKQIMDNAKNEFERASAELVAKVAPLRIDLCQKEYVSSVKVPAGKYLLGITWSSNYRKILGGSETEAELTRVIGGEEQFKMSFFSKFKIYADDKSETELYQLFCMLAPNDGETAEDVAIGQSRFASYFKVEETIKPTETFIRQHMFMSEAKKAELELAGVVQFTPSIKTR